MSYSAWRTGGVEPLWPKSTPQPIADPMGRWTAVSARPRGSGSKNDLEVQIGLDFAARRQAVADRSNMHSGLPARSMHSVEFLKATHSALLRTCSSAARGLRRRRRLTPGIAPWAALVFALSAASSAAAITLNEYVSQVVDTNPLVREQVHVYRQVAQDLDIAVSGWRPSLDFSASFGEFSRKAPNTSQQRRQFDSSQADLTLTQNLFSGFETTNQIKQARARISSAAFRLYDTADNIALQAVRAYLDLLSERRLVDLAAQNVESHERILAQIRELSDRGIIRRSDVEQTEGRLARAKASLIAQQNNLEDALTELHTLLGRYLDPSELSDPTLPPWPPDSVETLINRSLISHPAIQSAQKNVEAARYEYKRNRRTNFPNLDLSVQQSVGNDIDGPTGRTEESSIMLSLRYNLFRGGADRAQQRKSISAVHENKAFLDRVRRQTVDTLRLAWTADLSLQDQLPHLKRHAEKSLETVGLYREEFLLQRRDLIDLLDAESELNQALSRQTDAKYQGLTARYRVYEGLGTLFPALDLDVDLSDDDLRMSNIQANGLDPEALPVDRDADNVPDDRDQCVNTPLALSVDAYGCAQQRQLQLGYSGGGPTLVTADDSFKLESGGSLTISAMDLVGNDRSPDGDRPRLTGFGAPLHGTVTQQELGGSLVYSPPADFTGDDEFSYTVGDNRGRIATGKVAISVTLRPVPALPEDQVVRFEYKQLLLTEESQSRIDAIVERIREQPEIFIEVLAYTDNVGSAAYNQRLSELRADALRRMLIAAGIDGGRIEAFGMGENDPIADNATDEGRALNRRGEVRFRHASGN